MRDEESRKSNIKVACTGGGRGMRVVKTQEEIEENFNRATSEARAGL
jgi:pyruvate carboxylase